MFKKWKEKRRTNKIRKQALESFRKLEEIIKTGDTTFKEKYKRIYETRMILPPNSIVFDIGLYSVIAVYNSYGSSIHVRYEPLDPTDNSEAYVVYSTPINTIVIPDTDILVHFIETINTFNENFNLYNQEKKRAEEETNSLKSQKTSSSVKRQFDELRRRIKDE